MWNWARFKFGIGACFLLCEAQRGLEHSPTVPISVAVVLVAQSYPILCDLTDYSPPGSSVHGISQTGILKSVAFSSSRDLADPGIKLSSPVASALIGGLLYH